LQELKQYGFTIQEIVHSLLLMAYFHSMSSMLHALGIEASTTTKTYSYHVSLVICFVGIL